MDELSHNEVPIGLVIGGWLLVWRGSTKPGLPGLIRIVIGALIAVSGLYMLVG